MKKWRFLSHFSNLNFGPSFKDDALLYLPVNPLRLFDESHVYRPIKNPPGRVWYDSWMLERCVAYGSAFSFVAAFGVPGLIGLCVFIAGVQLIHKHRTGRWLGS